MKLVHKRPDGFINDRLNITRQEIPCLDSSWHYHAQYELLYISRSSGIRFVGDSVAQFSPGDLVLVGPYLPHLWRNDVSCYREDDTSSIKTIIIKFTRDFIGEGTFDYTEFQKINQMLDRSKFGISFGKTTSREMHHELMGIVDLSPARQSIKLLDMLNHLSLTGDKTVLSSADMRQYTAENSHRIDTVIKYISDHYTGYLTLQDVSDIACMTPNSFCRFFKRMTNKSFTRFLKEVRVRNAARLLAQDNLPISEVGYAVGYKSITNFNRQFKQITGSTPRDFLQTI